MKIIKALSLKPLLFCIVCITTIANLSFCNTQNTPKNNFHTKIDTNKFDIDLPVGWTRENKVSNGFNILFLISPPVDNFKPNLNILAEDMHGASLEDYFKTSTENMQKASMIQNGFGEFEVNGIKGKFSTSTYLYQGYNLALKTYIFAYNGLAYVLTGTCLDSQKDTYRPIFDKTVKTFRIK